MAGSPATASTPCWPAGALVHTRCDWCRAVSLSKQLGRATVLRQLAGPAIRCLLETLRADAAASVPASSRVRCRALGTEVEVAAAGRRQTTRLAAVRVQVSRRVQPVPSSELLPHCGAPSQTTVAGAVRAAELCVPAVLNSAAAAGRAKFRSSEPSVQSSAFLQCHVRPTK